MEPSEKLHSTGDEYIQTTSGQEPKYWRALEDVQQDFILFFIFVIDCMNK